MSSTVPTKIGDKWTVNRDPDEKSYYAADITQELSDRSTTADPANLELDLVGVAKLEEPDLQIVTVDSVQRTYVVVLLGPIDGDPPTDWHWTARVNCMNGERFDKTTWFNRVDT